MRLGRSRAARHAGGSRVHTVRPARMRVQPCAERRLEERGRVEPTRVSGGLDHVGVQDRDGDRAGRGCEEAEGKHG